MDYTSGCQTWTGNSDLLGHDGALKDPVPIAAIFIPLTFIAGIYGTNFEYLPELEFKYSYFIFWGVMVGVAVVMLSYFRKKKWL